MHDLLFQMVAVVFGSRSQMWVRQVHIHKWLPSCEERRVIHASISSPSTQGETESGAASVLSSSFSTAAFRCPLWKRWCARQI